MTAAVCSSGKQPHTSPQAVHRVIQKKTTRIRTTHGAKGRRGAVVGSAYRCGICNFYHLTSQKAER